MTEPKQRAPGWVDFLLLVGIGLIWGSSFILIKKGLEAYSPFQVGLLRICFAFLAFIPILLIRKPWFKKEQLPWILIVAFIGTGIPAFFYPIAQTRLDSSIASILNATVPLWTLIIGLVVFKAANKWTRTLAVLLGLLGVLLIFIKGIDNPAQNAAYGLLILLATNMYASSTNVVKHRLQDFDALNLTGLTFLFLGPIAFVFLAFSGFSEVLNTHDLAIPSLIYIGLLGLIGTALTNILFFRLVQRTSAIFATTVTYIIPIVALAWGALDGEPVGLIQVAGMMLILAGVYTASK